MLPRFRTGLQKAMHKLLCVNILLHGRNAVWMCDLKKHQFVFVKKVILRSVIWCHAFEDFAVQEEYFVPEPDAVASARGMGGYPHFTFNCSTFCSQK